MACTPWRLIRSGAMSGAENMALDEVLLEAVARGESAPVLRIYRWRIPTVTLGYGQRDERAVDGELCRSLGIDVVRRITGGRAVLHDCEATYAVISPEGTALFPGGILDNYRTIAKVLQRTLADFGLAVELEPARRRAPPGKPEELRNICFAAPSAHELTYRGCKVAGSSQKRFQGAFLQHGSIPLELDLEQLGRILPAGGASSPKAGARVLGRCVGWVNRWLDSPISLDELERRLIANFIDRMGLEIVESRPTVDEMLRMRRLATDKYGDPWETDDRCRVAPPGA